MSCRQTWHKTGELSHPFTVSRPEQGLCKQPLPLWPAVFVPRQRINESTISPQRILATARKHLPFSGAIESSDQCELPQMRKPLLLYLADTNRRLGETREKMAVVRSTEPVST